MSELPHDFVSLLLLVFALGMKHGFDADHLATIDGITRYNAARKPWLSRYAGTLFSLGHGAVVIVIALLVCALAGQWQTPQWLNASGAWISIGVLSLLAWLNLRAVFAAAPHEVVRPLGLRGRLFGRISRSGNPALVALIGALFAISFDTISQAALFALAATRYGGWEHALVLSLGFVAGMLLTDGINGLWIARLIRRADETALLASRVMALAVGGMSLLVASFGAAKLMLPTIDAWSEGKELVFGVAVLAVIGGSYLLAQRMTRSAEEQRFAS